MPRISQKTVEKTVMRLMEKPMRRKLQKMTLPQQVLYARKVLRTTGVIEMRRNLLNGIGEEMVDDIKAGKTQEVGFARYLDCPEFMEFWGELDLNAEHVEELGRQATEGQASRLEASEEAYTDRRETLKIDGKKVGRNDPCPCGSGKKYKKCCQ